MRYSEVLNWGTLLLLAICVSSFSPPPSRAATSCRKVVSLPLLALVDNRDDKDTEADSLVYKPNPTETTLVYMFPVAATFSAFTFYENTSKGFHAVVQAASQNKWIPVDGGALIGDIILPAINGPVLGTIGLLFATLVSTTIGNLYQRQVSISNSIVREVDDLRRLGYLLQSLPQPYRREAQTELKKFVNTIFDAAQKRSFSGATYRDVTLAPIFVLLNKISHDRETDAALKVSGNILGEGYELVRRINDQRTSIAVLLRPAFPTLHYANLVALASCICLVFLIETDRDVMFFLAGFQLRLLWSILIGIITMMATVIYDLESPFAGSYNVSVNSCTIKDELAESNTILRTAQVISSTDKELEILKEYVTRPWED